MQAVVGRGGYCPDADEITMLGWLLVPGNFGSSFWWLVSGGGNLCCPIPSPETRNQNQMKPNYPVGVKGCWALRLFGRGFWCALSNGIRLD